MPIYEYACAACHHQFEEWQKMSDPPVRTCPKCKKKKVERLISATAFQLKGGGWYKDLYSSSKPGASKDGGEGGSEGGKSKSEGGASKSDGKSDGKSGERKSPDAKASDSSAGKSASKDAKGDGARDSGKKAPAKKSDSRAA